MYQPTCIEIMLTWYICRHEVQVEEEVDRHEEETQTDDTQHYLVRAQPTQQPPSQHTQSPQIKSTHFDTKHISDERHS